MAKSKKSMLEFLNSHHRYDTMNSWNRSTSYSRNMKIYNVIPAGLQDKAFELLGQGEVFDEINDLINEWDREQDYDFQAQWNGRSGGYLVIIRGGYNLKTLFTFEGNNKERDYEDNYGWMNKDEAIKRGLYKKQLKQIFIKPGQSIGEDISEESDAEEIKSLYKLVKSFDKLTDKIIKCYISYCKSYNVVEKEITVPKTIKVLEAV